MSTKSLGHMGEESAAIYLAKNGYEIIGEDYKKDHFPDMKECSLKMLLNKKSFYIGKEISVNASVYKEDLADEIAECFQQMQDIFRILADEQ